MTNLLTFELVDDEGVVFPKGIEAKVAQCHEDVFHRFQKSRLTTMKRIKKDVQFAQVLRWCTPPPPTPPTSPPVAIESVEHRRARTKHRRTYMHGRARR